MLVPDLQCQATLPLSNGRSTFTAPLWVYKKTTVVEDNVQQDNMSIDAIHTFAPRSEELLAALQQTDYAEAALKQQDLYVQDLRKELADLDWHIERYEVKTNIEKKEFEQYRDSTMKRFAYKIGGQKEKFKSRTEKEEREYYEALEKERSAKDRRESLERALNEAVPVLEHYRTESNNHTAAQSELDNLYNMVFGGPTPSYPHEDQSEWRFTQARETFNNIEQQHRAIQQAVDIFGQARKHINTAALHMSEARGASQWDVLGGGAFADMAERNALGRAQSEVLQVENLISQAQRLHPIDMIRVDIAHGHIGDVLFDNILSDLAMHDEIKRSQAQVVEAQKSIDQQLCMLQQELASHQPELDAKQAALTNARRELQGIRADIFKQVGSPPAYS